MKHSPWWRGATFYQVYPRSFADSNGDGIGDLAGVASRLEHVASLGVDGIWLSPVFPSPMRDFGYDVSDYCAVDPMFGTLADFSHLLARAHALGLKVIIDQVWSHCALEHPWFQESRQSRDNAKADWFVWADARPDGSVPNNWQSWMGGGTWTWEARRQQYYLHNFLPQMPDLNFHCPAVQDAVLEVARFWLALGVDGFRLDTANYYFHDRELKDNPPQPPERRGDCPAAMQQHVHNICQPENLGFLGRIREVLDAHGERMAVAEIGSADNLARMIEYTQGDARLHTAYSFVLLGERPTPSRLADLMAPWQDARCGGDKAWPSWALSNHDVPRVATRWAGNDAQRARVCMALLASLRGTLFLYQGEELGLPQAELAYDDLRDPIGKAQWPRNKGRDGCRTPMPWHAAAPAAGFTTGKPWLPLSESHPALAVDLQESEPGSMLHFTRALLAMRRAHVALRLGSFTTLQADEQVLVVLRVHEDDAVIAAFNLGEAPRTVELAQPPKSTGAAVSVGDVRLDGSRLALGPWSAWLVAVQG